MKNKVSLFSIGLGMAALLASCAGIKPRESFRVEFYDDAETPNLLAYDNVMKGHQAIYRFKVSDDAYTVSKQAPVTGHHWVWSGWAGTYGEPAEGDTFQQGEAIDLDNIQGSCKVYSQFESVIDTYTVDFYNGNTKLDSFKVDYQHTLSEQIGAGHEKTALPVATMGAYYEDYAFEGWLKDEETVSVTNESVLSMPIVGDTKFSASFAEMTLRQFEVKFYKDATLSETLMQSEMVEYGSAITATTEGKPGENGSVYQFLGWAGTYSTASSEDSAIAYLDGKSIDASCIRYECSVYPLYAEVATPKKVTVNFYDQAGNNLLGTETVDYGSSVRFAGTEPSAEGLDFAGWTTNPNKSGDMVDLSSVTEDTDVYAALVDHELSLTEGGVSSHYTFSKAQSGYVLDEIEAGTATAITADQIGLEGVLPCVRLVAIGEGVFMDNQSIQEITLPATVKNVAPQAFMNASKLEQLTATGLESVGIYAFSGCSSLSQMDLSGLTEIGTKAFEKTAFTSVTLKADGTVTKVGSKIFYHSETVQSYVLNGTDTSKFASDWNVIDEQGNTIQAA